MRVHMEAYAPLVVGALHAPHQIASKKWRVDLHSKQEASLQLSAVHLPGGVQRRRTAEDELAMRDIFTEGDLISVRVWCFFGIHHRAHHLLLPG